MKVKIKIKIKSKPKIKIAGNPDARQQDQLGLDVT